MRIQRPREISKKGIRDLFDLLRDAGTLPPDLEDIGRETYSRDVLLLESGETGCRFLFSDRPVLWADYSQIVEDGQGAIGVIMVVEGVPMFAYHGAPFTTNDPTLVGLHRQGAVATGTWLSIEHPASVYPRKFSPLANSRLCPTAFSLPVGKESGVGGQRATDLARPSVTCPNARRLFVQTKPGEIRRGEWFCGRKDCPVCGPQRIRRETARLLSLARNEIFKIATPGTNSSAMSQRLRDHNKAKRAKGLPEIGWIAISQATGTKVFLVSDHILGSEPVRDAVREIRTIFDGEGSGNIAYGGTWRRRREPQEEDDFTPIVLSSIQQSEVESRLRTFGDIKEDWRGTPIPTPDYGTQGWEVWAVERGLSNQPKARPRRRRWKAA